MIGFIDWVLVGWLVYFVGVAIHHVLPEKKKPVAATTGQNIKA